MASWILLILFVGTICGLIGGMWMLFYNDPRNYAYNSSPSNKEDRINAWGFVAEIIGAGFLIALAVYLEHAPAILKLLDRINLE